MYYNVRVRKMISTIEAHNAGMPIRIVLLPRIPGKTMQEKKRYCEQELEWLRKMLMLEPRGGRNAYGIVVTSPSSEQADFGAIYMDPSGWHDMCGHASMGFASIAVQIGLVNMREPITKVVLDTPAGLVTVDVEVREGKVQRTSLINVPSFVLREETVSIEGYGKVNVYIAYGGNFYAIVNLNELGMKYSPSILNKLVSIAKAVWNELEGLELKHPVTGIEHRIYGIRFVETLSRDPYRAYGILIFGSKDRPLIDRSPSGTGSSAHLAYLRYMNEIDVGTRVEFLSAIDTAFYGEIVEEFAKDGLRYTVPKITTADKGGHITGFATWILEEGDRVGEGFILEH